VQTLPSAAPPRSLFWPLQLGGWALFGAGMFAAGVSHWPVLYAAVVKASLTLFGFSASLLLRAAYRGLARRGAPLPALVAAAIPLSYGAAALWMAPHNLVVASYLASHRTGVFRVETAGFPDFVNTIYFFFVLLCWSALYFGIAAYRDLAAGRERLLRAEARAHAARLEALRLQLNPHFLFNALNAVSTLIAEDRPSEANRMLARLSDFLRSTLERSDTAEVPLSDEIDFACQYLEIEEIRFGERLRVDIAIDPAAESALVPPLILQPLVENAVRHAVLPRTDGGAISIVAGRDAEWLTLGVHDEGPGAGPRVEWRSGIGLANTRQRLEELYGTRAELTLDASARGGLALSIRLPYRRAPEAA
jgi:two-component system LytT family sensor kinase